MEDHREDDLSDVLISLRLILEYARDGLVAAHRNSMDDPRTRELLRQKRELLSAAADVIFEYMTKVEEDYQVSLAWRRNKKTH